MIQIRVMTILDYDGIYDLWLQTSGMELNLTVGRGLRNI